MLARLGAVRSGQPRTSAENNESERQAFSLSPMKSICTAARELELKPTNEQGSTQKVTIVCLQRANVTETSAKCQAKTKRVCRQHAATNF